jgi:hypothetical protein
MSVLIWFRLLIIIILFFSTSIKFVKCINAKNAEYREIAFMKYRCNLRWLLSIQSQMQEAAESVN